MRGTFLRAVLLGALAALALLVAKRAWAEKTVFICTSSTAPSPLRIEKDTDQKTITVEDVTRSTKDLYPLTQVSAQWLEAMPLKRYDCRPDR
jgi:hypothetical protein